MPILEPQNDIPLGPSVIFHQEPVLQGAVGAAQAEPEDPNLTPPECRVHNAADIAAEMELSKERFGDKIKFFFKKKAYLRFKRNFKPNLYGQPRQRNRFIASHGSATYKSDYSIIHRRRARGLPAEQGIYPAQILVLPMWQPRFWCCPCGSPNFGTPCPCGTRKLVAPYDRLRT